MKYSGKILSLSIKSHRFSLKSPQLALKITQTAITESFWRGKTLFDSNHCLFMNRSSMHLATLHENPAPIRMNRFVCSIPFGWLPCSVVTGDLLIRTRSTYARTFVSHPTAQPPNAQNSQRFCRPLISLGRGHCMPV